MPANMGRHKEVQGHERESFLIGTEGRSLLTKAAAEQGTVKSNILRNLVISLDANSTAKELGRLTLKLAETQQTNENLAAENKALREQVAALEARDKRIAIQRRRSGYGDAMSLAFQ